MQTWTQPSGLGTGTAESEQGPQFSITMPSSELFSYSQESYMVA